MVLTHNKSKKIFTLSSSLLSPDSIKKIIFEEEIPLRRRSFPPETVDTVLRYGEIVGSSIKHSSHIVRGMDEARRLIHDAEEKELAFHSGTVILADEMAESKGRFKRPWHAPKGGLWLTLILVNTLLPESSLLVPMAAGVACCEVLRNLGIAAHIKWVNDVHVDGKKICGILTEAFTGSRHREEYILVGIGMNVNNDSFPTELSGLATSVKACLNKESSLAEIAAQLLVKLRWNIGLLHFEEAQNLEEHGGVARRNSPVAATLPDHEPLLLKSYKSLTDIFNRRVIFGFDVQKTPQFEAKVMGLDNMGGLILELDDSSLITQYSGEIIYL